MPGTSFSIVAALMLMGVIYGHVKLWNKRIDVMLPNKLYGHILNLPESKRSNLEKSYLFNYRLTEPTLNSTKN
jgi:hypothetical protein